MCTHRHVHNQSTKQHSAAGKPGGFIQLCIDGKMAEQSANVSPLRETSTGLQRPLTAFQ